jgi:DNA ligase D-like protein (predicted ligase)
MPTLLTPPALEVVLQGLHESEIRCGIKNEPPVVASLPGSTSAAELRRRLFTGPSLVIGRSGPQPIASRRRCTRPHCAFSLIAPMPKRTEVDRRARASRRRVKSAASGSESAHPPKWIEPQLTRLADEAPEGSGWLHEIKYDGYRMHARIDSDKIQLLTRTGLDWSHRYPRTIEALGSLKVKSAYVDGELCALNSDGVPLFSRLQAAMDEGKTDKLVFFAFDLLFLNGESTAELPLIQRKVRLQRLFKKEIGGLRYSEHIAGDGPTFRTQACKLGLEGVISKRADRPYAPGDRGIWVKSKCLNREEFVVVGWTDQVGGTLVPCCLVTTPKMDACTTPVAQAPA